MNKILIIAPHPDDEILGCGASIRKKINEGNDVFVLVLTNANIGMPEFYSKSSIENVRKEASDAHNFLGIKQTIFKDFPAPILDQFPIARMAQEINDIILDLGINCVYVPHRGDIHIDHRVTFDAAMVACRPTGNCPVKQIFAYETLSETEWSHPYASNIFIPNYFEMINQEDFNSKIVAFKYFKSQVREFPASRSLEAIEALAKYRGATINTARAEAFMIIRLINDYNV